MTNPNQPVEIEFTPDRVGVEFLRQLADGIEAFLDDQGGAVVELPFAIPKKLDHAALVQLAVAIDQTGALEAGPATGLDLETVWVVFDAFLFVGTGNRPTDLIDALIDVGSSMSAADEKILRKRVNAWLRRTGHRYRIVQDEEGEYRTVENAPAPEPAFKIRRMTFEVLSRPRPGVGRTHLDAAVPGAGCYGRRLYDGEAA